MSIRPQVLRIIHCLSESPGEVISTEALTAVSKSGSYGCFRVNLSEARTALKDMGVPNAILTVRESGYFMTSAKARSVKRALASPLPTAPKSLRTAPVSCSDSNNTRLTPRAFSWEEEA